MSMTPNQSQSLIPNKPILEETMYNWNNSSNTTNSSVHPAPPFLPCDNPRNVVSPYVADIADLVILGGIIPVFVTSGVITNVINMVVFARQGLSDRIHLCLFSLAVSDTGFLLFSMAGKSYALIKLVDPVVGNFWVQGHYSYVLGSYVSFQVISNIITAIIAMDRCLCITSPLKAAKFFRTKHTALVIVVMAVYTLTVVNTAICLKYQVWQISDPLTNTTTFITRLGPIYLRHRTFFDIMYLCILLVAIPSISLVIVIVCTTVIIFRLKVATSWRRKSVSAMTSVEKQEVAVTRMLVTVCCVYVLCMTPPVIRSLVLLSRIPGFLTTGYLCNVFNLAVNLTLVFEAFNASINFHIYIRQSSRYRSTLKQLSHCTTSMHRRKK